MSSNRLLARATGFKLPRTLAATRQAPRAAQFSFVRTLRAEADENADPGMVQDSVLNGIWADG